MVDQRGSVTAEFAAVMPVVVLVLAACLAAAQLGVHHLRLQDAAAQAARALARGDPIPALIANLGAHLEPSLREGLLCVRVSASTPGLAALLPGNGLAATACAPEHGL